MGKRSELSIRSRDELSLGISLRRQNRDREQASQVRHVAVNGMLLNELPKRDHVVQLQQATITEVIIELKNPRVEPQKMNLSPMVCKKSE